MALTGVYRQTLQQIFSIQIQDELSQGNSTGFESENSFGNTFPVVHEFKDDKTKEVSQNNTVQAANVQNTQAQNTVTDQTITGPTEITEDYIENEFANYFSGGEVA